MQQNNIKEDAFMKTEYELNRGRIYHIWARMKERCYNPQDKSYCDYGGRGIVICEEWMFFDNFYWWAINHGYKPNLSIDRKDVNDIYKPDNCRWVSRKVQSNNKRNNRLITYNGRTMTLTQWANEVGIKPHTLRKRIEMGWSIEKALHQEVDNSYNHRTHS